jgi:hypothetical protein
MAEENRTPDKKIGEIQHAEEQTKRTTGHLPPHGPSTPDPKETVRANPELSKKKTGISAYEGQAGTLTPKRA